MGFFEGMGGDYFSGKEGRDGEMTNTFSDKLKSGQVVGDIMSTGVAALDVFKDVTKGASDRMDERGNVTHKVDWLGNTSSLMAEGAKYGGVWGAAGGAAAGIGLSIYDSAQNNDLFAESLATEQQFDLKESMKSVRSEDTFAQQSTMAKNGLDISSPKEVEVEKDEIVLRKVGKAYKKVADFKGGKTHGQGGENYTAEEGDVIFPGKMRGKINRLVKNKRWSSIESARHALPKDVPADGKLEKGLDNKFYGNINSPSKSDKIKLAKILGGMDAVDNLVYIINTPGAGNTGIAKLGNNKYNLREAVDLYKELEKTNDGVTFATLAKSLEESNYNPEPTLVAKYDGTEYKNTKWGDIISGANTDKYVGDNKGEFDMDRRFAPGVYSDIKSSEELNPADTLKTPKGFGPDVSTAEVADKTLSSMEDVDVTKGLDIPEVQITKDDLKDVSLPWDRSKFVPEGGYKTEKEKADRKNNKTPTKNERITRANYERNSKRIKKIDNFMESINHEGGIEAIAKVYAAELEKLNEDNYDANDRSYGSIKSDKKQIQAIVEKLGKHVGIDKFSAEDQSILYAKFVKDIMPSVNKSKVIQNLKQEGSTEMFKNDSPAKDIVEDSYWSNYIKLSSDLSGYKTPSTGKISVSGNPLKTYASLKDNISKDEKYLSRTGYTPPSSVEKPVEKVAETKVTNTKSSGEKLTDKQRKTIIDNRVGSKVDLESKGVSLETPNALDEEKNKLADRIDKTIVDSSPNSEANSSWRGKDFASAVTNNLGELSKYSGAMYNLAKGMEDPEKIKRRFISPQTKQFEDKSQPQLNAIDRAFETSLANSRNLSGGSMANYRSNAEKAWADKLSRTNEVRVGEANRAEQVASANIDTRNRAEEFNQQVNSQADQVDMQSKAATDSFFAQGMQDIANIGAMSRKDRNKEKAQTNALDIMSSGTAFDISKNEDDTFSMNFRKK